MKKSSYPMHTASSKTNNLRKHIKVVASNLHPEIISWGVFSNSEKYPNTVSWSTNQLVEHDGVIIEKRDTNNKLCRVYACSASKFMEIINKYQNDAKKQNQSCITNASRTREDEWGTLSNLPYSYIPDELQVEY